MEKFAESFGKLFGLYFIVYPVLYFGYNFLVTNLDMAQYRIPGFWIGMLGFFLIVVTRNIIFRKG